MTSLAARVLRAIKRLNLIPADSRVAAAVSGGPDSVALALLLEEVAVSAAITLSGLVHVNHRLRAGDADADEAFCRQFAGRLGVPFCSTSVDVARRARERRMSLERAGHEARYEWYEQVRLQLPADLVATGHTRNDQAETLLLRLFRGAGARGLGGIHPRVGHVIRPLLGITRREIEEYLAERRVEYRVDGSNADRRIPRNRVRHELLPFIGREFAPAIVDTLARTAELARDDAEALEGLATEAYPSVVSREGDRLRLDVRVLGLPVAVARRVVRRAFATEGAGLSYEHVEAILRLCEAPVPAGGLDLPGLRVEREASAVVAAPAVSGRRRRRRGWFGGLVPAAPTPSTPAPLELPVPGAVTLREGLGTLSASWEPSTEPAGVKGSEVVRVDPSRLALPLRVRFRQPGDRFRPIGAPGRRKLQDVFVDRKVPRARRERTPIVVDAADRIVWVVGHGIAEEYRAPSDATGVLLLTFSPLGGLV